jgi:hypothetical protein
VSWLVLLIFRLLVQACSSLFKLRAATPGANQVVLVVMLSISTWCGVLTTTASFSTSVSTLAPNKLNVFAKLNNKFLGVVDNPFSQRGFTWEASYDGMRNLQARVSHLLKHKYLPSRYLVLYVGDVRLTEPNFPFVNHLKLKPQVRRVLQDAQSISVIYHLDQSCAEASLKKRGLTASWTAGINDLQVVCDSTAPKQQTVLALPELDVWAMEQRVTRLEFRFEADKLGRLDYFPDLTCLDVSFQIKEVDFKSLAKTCKLLQSLFLSLESSSSPNLLDGVGELSNLKDLVLVIKKPKNAVCVSPCLIIPPEVGKLEKLTHFHISGGAVYGVIPKEISKLTNLKILTLRRTNLLGFLPPELGLLTNLHHLDLGFNPGLFGTIPSTLQNLAVCLAGTPRVKRSGL